MSVASGVVLLSTKNCTSVTPTLSEAVAARFTVLDTGTPSAGAARLTVGLVLSTVTVTVDVVVLPAASRAPAVNVWVPLATVVVFHDAL